MCVSIASSRSAGVIPARLPVPAQSIPLRSRSGFASCRARIADFATLSGSLSNVIPFGLLVISVKLGSDFLICSIAEFSILATSSRIALLLAAISTMFWACSSGRSNSLTAFSIASGDGSSGRESSTVFAICISDSRPAAFLTASSIDLLLF